LAEEAKMQAGMIGPDRMRRNIARRPVRSRNRSARLRSRATQGRSDRLSSAMRNKFGALVETKADE
jgi:hypothetical protein